MNVLLNAAESASYWDWNDFWQTVLASALGFVFALLSSVIFQIVLMVADKGQIKKGIITEFSAIKEQLTSIDFNAEYILPISTAYWESLIQGSKFSMLYKVSWYPPVSKCYLQIKMLNEHIATRNEKRLESRMEADSGKAAVLRAVAMQMEALISEQCDENGKETVLGLINSTLKLITKEKGAA